MDRGRASHGPGRTQAALPRITGAFNCVHMSAGPLWGACLPEALLYVMHLQVFFRDRSRGGVGSSCYSPHSSPFSCRKISPPPPQPYMAPWRAVSEGAEVVWVLWSDSKEESRLILLPCKTASEFHPCVIIPHFLRNWSFLSFAMFSSLQILIWE